MKNKLSAKEYERLKILHLKVKRNKARKRERKEYLALHCGASIEQIENIMKG